MAIQKIIRKNGTRYRVREYGPDGRQYGRVWKRRVDAEREQTKLRSQFYEGQVPKTEAKLSLSDFVDEYLKTHAVPNLSFTGRERYEGALRKYILPYFGNFQLSKITRLDIERFKASIAGMGSASTIFTILKTVLYKAVEWEYLRGNPAEFVKAPLKNPPREEHWSESEVNKFLMAMENHPRLPLYLIVLNTGLREGEIFGLKWDCIDFESNLIQIRRSFCQKQKIFREHTKTKHSWIIKMNQPLRSLLFKLKASATDDRVLRAEEIGCKDMTHIAKIFAGDARSAGVRVIRFHDLRHTYASLFMNRGGKLFKLSKNLGHKKTAMTDRYAHYSPEFCDESDVVAIDVPKLANVIPLRHE